MSVFPIKFDDKINSPELLAFLQAYSPNLYVTAEEINLFRDALNELNNRLGGSGVVFNSGFILEIEKIIFNPTFQWKLNGESFIINDPLEINIPYAESGKHRIDLIVGTKGDLIRVPGIEVETNKPAVEPIFNYLTQLRITAIAVKEDGFGEVIILDPQEIPTLDKVVTKDNKTNKEIIANGGIEINWNDGYLKLGKKFSSNNRSFNFNSKGDGVTVNDKLGIELNFQPDIPIQIKKKTESGDNSLEIDDQILLSAMAGVKFISAAGLNKLFLDEFGFGFSIDNERIVNFRTDNLTENRYIQVPDQSGVMALKGHITLKDVLEAGGEAYLGEYPNYFYTKISNTEFYIQNQASHPFENDNFISNLLSMNNNGIELKYYKADIETNTISKESALLLNDNGLGIKLRGGPLAFFKTDQLSGIGHKTYQMPDVDGGTILTTKGTTEGFSIEGNFQFADGEHDFEIFNTNSQEDKYRGGLLFGGSGISLTASNEGNNSLLTLYPNVMSVTFSNVNSPGIVGQEDYSNNLLDTSFAQKTYVDKNRLSKFTVSTLPTNATIGDTAYVEDALSPAYLSPVNGGGNLKCPVFYNGTNWVCH